MNSYLHRCRSVLKIAMNKIAVIGNESCDLDSAVSSIAFAFHLHHSPKMLSTWYQNDTLVFPVLNVTRAELPLKTEVTFFLKREGIALDVLICRDDIDWSAEQTLNVVLVDHHVSKLQQNIIGIVDHRPVESNARFNPNAFTTIELVGSCATLVGREVFSDRISQEHWEGYSAALELLYGAIVLDTVNFSKEADKAKPLDHELAAKIESHLQITEHDSSRHRSELFKSLVAARSDVSELNAYQLLLKDLKIISQNSRTVAIPGFPMAVQDYIKLPEQNEHLKRFTASTGSNVVILLGMKVLPDGTVRRDVGIVPIDDKPLAEQIITALHACQEMNFELEEIPCWEVKGTFYQQQNLKASRKQLIPIVKNVLSTIPVENIVILLHNMFGGPIAKDGQRLKPLQKCIYTTMVILMSVTFFTLCLFDLHHMLYSRDLVLSVIDLLMLLGIATAVFAIQSSALLKHLYKSKVSMFQCVNEIDSHLYTLNMRRDPAHSFATNCLVGFGGAVIISLGYLLANALRINRTNGLIFTFKAYGLFVIFLTHGLFLVFSYQIWQRIRYMVKHLEKMITTIKRLNNRSSTDTGNVSLRLCRDLKTLAIVQLQCFKAINRLNDECGLANVSIFGMFFYVLTAKSFQLFYICSIEFKRHGFTFTHLLGKSKELHSNR
uniref:DHHA2 domain-containing protein n=1 Tax=Anopheles christyi TaxID=43041 RepID=A0A182JNP7_9DIPT